MEQSFAAATTDAFLLTCIDFRFVHLEASYMATKCLAGNYDTFALAGASLGVAQYEVPRPPPNWEEWARTFWWHLDFAVTEHRITKVVVMDHQDCAAYKIFVGDDSIEAHTKQLQRLWQEIQARHGALSVELLFLDLACGATTIPPPPQP